MRSARIWTLFERNPVVFLCWVSRFFRMAMLASLNSAYVLLKLGRASLMVAGSLSVYLSTAMFIFIFWSCCIVIVGIFG